MKRISFCFVLILLLSCSNDKKTVDTFTRRILKINLLTTSSNVDTYYLNSLDDSLRIIKSDLNLVKVQQANKDILTNLIDSVSEIIHVARVTNCIIGNEFSRKSKHTDKELKESLGGGEDILTKMFSDGQLTETVKIKKNYECEISHHIDDVASQFINGFYAGTDKRNYMSNETYKYIGNDEFQISNGWILKVTDAQKCEVELLTDSELKKGKQTKPLASSENVNNDQASDKQISQKQKQDAPSNLAALMKKYNVSPSKDAYGTEIVRIDNYPGGGVIFYLDKPNGGRVKSITDPNKSGTWSDNQLNKSLSLFNKEQSADLTSIQPQAKDITEQKQTQPQNPEERPRLIFHQCQGTYSPGCVNTDAIAQVQRCLDLTTARHPRGSGYYDYILHDKLSSMGYKNGFTDADIPKICEMAAKKTKPFRIQTQENENSIQQTGKQTPPKQPQSPNGSKLTFKECQGKYTLGCKNADAIAQVQRCLGLTTSENPRGSGYFDEALQDKLSAMGFENGFTDADVSKICEMDGLKQYESLKKMQGKNH